MAWQDRDVAEPQQEPGPSRRELVNAASLAARLHQNAYDRFEDAASEYVGVNRTAMRCMDVLERVGRLTPGEIGRASCRERVLCVV